VTEVCEAVEIEGGVLVGHDGSAGAQEALLWAAGLAGRAGLHLHVVRAWGMTTAPRPKQWHPGYVPPLGDYEQAVLDELDGSVAGARLDPCLPVRTHVIGRQPATALIEVAKGADLLVVAARGVGGFSGLLTPARRARRRGPRQRSLLPTYRPRPSRGSRPAGRASRSPSPARRR